ncbi:MAG: zinc-dependent metalloprotease [Opitutaceae bacterium]|nr:zinc-dependent metalloprotease [Opitutaceae bacterium]
MRRLMFRLFRLVPAAAIAAAPVYGAAPEHAGGKPAGAKDETAEPPAIVSIAEAIEDTVALPGLLSLYRDTVTGSLLLRLRPEQLDRDYIQCTFVQDGPAIAGFFRGDFRDNRLITLRRTFDRVEVVARNTAFYFDPASPLARAATANRLDSVLAVVPILGADEKTGEIVVEADGLFLDETLTQVTPPPPEDEEAAKQMFALGELDPERTRVVSVRNYPDNTDVVVDYVFANPAPTVRGGPDVTDPRFVTVRMQHSIIAAPKNDYQPRFDDPRVGYFTVEQTDLTSTRPAPYRDMITRWHLVKKDPAAAVSEPVEPITFWMENTTPRELRPLVRAGAMLWNRAFEAAGFRDAIVVKEQPDDASWDAGDIRYNVLRWASSPQPQFGGLGPSFVDPRTGQILGADIMFEFVYLTNRSLEESIFPPRPARGRQACCTLAAHRQSALMLGRAVAETRDLGEAVQQQLVREAVTELVAHEVGHVLGLMHNKRGSQLHPPAELHDAALTRRIGLSGSVMDYNQINLAPPGVAQGQFFPEQLGPYDIWAIQCGYTPALADPQAEAARLGALLARSTEPALAFGNDTDECTEPGQGVDPRVLSQDMGSDPATVCAGRFALLRETAASLALRTAAPGSSHEAVALKYRVLLRDATDLTRTLAVQIGGVQVDRAFAGQPGATQPFTPVPAAEQRRALAVLRREVFGPEAFRAPAELFARLQRQRRGFHFEETQEEPTIHAEVLKIQAMALDHMLHPRVLDRLTDATLYGGDFTVATFGAELTAAIFADDADRAVSTLRQNLQTTYVEKLAAMLASQAETPLAPVNRAMAVQQLQALRRQLAARAPADISTDAHVAHLLLLIGRALDTGRPVV